MKIYLNEIKGHGSFNMVALKELLHFKNIIKKRFPCCCLKYDSNSKIELMLKLHSKLKKEHISLF